MILSLLPPVLESIVSYVFTIVTNYNSPTNQYSMADPEVLKAGGRVEVISRPFASNPYDHKLDRHGVCRSSERVKKVNYPHLLLYMMYHTL